MFEMAMDSRPEKAFGQSEAALLRLEPIEYP